MNENLDALKRLAQQIRNATDQGENTAERVGKTLVGILELLGITDLEALKSLFIRKDQADSTNYLLSLLGGALVEKGIVVRDSDIIEENDDFVIEEHDNLIEETSDGNVIIQGNSNIHFTLFGSQSVARECTLLGNRFKIKKLHIKHGVIPTDSFAVLYRKKKTAKAGKSTFTSGSYSVVGPHDHCQYGSSTAYTLWDKVTPIPSWGTGYKIELQPNNVDIYEIAYDALLHHVRYENDKLFFSGYKYTKNISGDSGQIYGEYGIRIFSPIAGAENASTVQQRYNISEMVPFRITISRCWMDMNKTEKGFSMKVTLK